MRIDVGGLEVAVETVGAGPEAVLFVHGLGSSRAIWKDAPGFFDPRRHRLVLVDLPGAGESDAPEAHDFSMTSMADALEKVLAALGIGATHLVAHSMGGAVALLVASRGRIEPLSFASAEGNLVSEDAFMSSKVARLKEAAFVRVFTKWLRMAEESLGPDRTATHETFLASLGATKPHALHRASVSCLELTRSGELGRLWSGLACPRLYVAGEKTRAARGLPAPVVESGCEVVTVPGAGHFVMGAGPGFYAPVRRFVDACDRAQSGMSSE